MSSLLPIILLLTLFLIQVHAIPDDVNATVPTIIQQRPLHNCQLKVGFGGVYLCGNTSYLMGDLSSLQSYSNLKIAFPNALDVDSDQEYMVVVQADRIQVYKETTQLLHGDIKYETPLMIRIKKRSQYICIVMLSHLPSQELEISNPAPNRFLLRTFIVDQLVNVHEIDLPNQGLDLALETDSFIGLTLLEDRTYGREYILVALKPNWIYISKTLYQDAEIEQSVLVKLDTDYQIIDFLSERDYLFTLLSHPITSQLKVSIYRIQDRDNQMKLHNQCDILIPHRSTPSNLKPSLKIKNIRSLYMFAVNFPGDEILVYHFQETWYNKLTNQCPEQGPSIKYADYQIQEQYGYAFDFVIIPARVFVIHGFLLTSISTQVNSSAFITYCFPNHYLLNTGVCVPCRDSSSPGGPTAQCKECQIDNLHTSAQSSDPYQETCSVQCKETGKFGPQCSECSDFMNSLDLHLPAGAYWSVDTKSQCTLFCKEGFADLMTGTCLTQEQNEVKLNNCEQLQDCYNCSLSLHCIWKNSTCQSFTPAPGKPSKSQFLTDFIEPGLACPKKAVCGPTKPFSDMSGTIELGADYIGKNQVCAWEITVPEGKFRDILVSINATGLNPHRADNPNIIFVTCCMLYKSNRRCQLQAFPLKDNIRNITCAGGNFAYLTYWSRKSAQGAHKNFKMTYNISESSGFGDFLTETVQTFIERVFKWFVSFLVFLSIFSALTRMQARRIRRRFLVELQEMGNFDELNQSEQDHDPINIQEVLDDQRLVSRVSYHENILNEYQQSECPICLEEFQIKESLIRLNCKHLFHIKCFEDWAAAAHNNHIKCPVCNNILI